MLPDSHLSLTHHVEAASCRSCLCSTVSRITMTPTTFYTASHESVVNKQYNMIMPGFSHFLFT
jgi:hypothetical protein